MGSARVWMAAVEGLAPEKTQLHLEQLMGRSCSWNQEKMVRGAGGLGLGTES